MIAISYRREDSLPIAGRLYDRLEQRFGKESVFMDFDSIRPGFSFPDQIRDAIERAKVLVAIIGPRWLGEQSDGSRRIDDPTDFVRLEVAYALQSGIRVFPVLVNNTPMPNPDALPIDIRPLVFLQALPLDSGLDFRQHANRLIDSILSARGRKPRTRIIAIAVASGLAVTAILLLSGYLGKNRVRSDQRSSEANFNKASPSKEFNPTGEITSRPPRASFLQNGVLMPLYTGTIRVQNDEKASGRSLRIALNPDLKSGTMSQGSSHGDVVVKFDGVWEGVEFKAVTGDIVSQPPGIQWTPESFTLHFSEDGKTASYRCVADAKTYFADLSRR